MSGSSNHFFTSELATMPGQFITCGEAARLLTVARAHIAKLVAAGTLTATDFALKVRFARIQVAAAG
ncbi:hypothetical protein BCAR13_70032 [Paraburkholderia caribensis]|nr:hypothetical protein BCAR13_70032 [Paraburkholderia caribensis]